MSETAINPLNATRADVMTVAIKFSSLLRNLMSADQIKAALERNHRNKLKANACSTVMYIDRERILLAALGCFGIRAPLQDDYYNFFKDVLEVAFTNDYNPVKIDEQKKQLEKSASSDDPVKKAIASILNTLLGVLSQHDLDTIVKSEAACLAASLNGNSAHQLDCIKKSLKVVDGIVEKMLPYQIDKIKSNIKTESANL